MVCEYISKKLQFPLESNAVCTNEPPQSFPTPISHSIQKLSVPMGRPPCCDKANVKRGPWTPEEDAKILAYVASHGIGNWTLVPQKAGLNRCGKSCRLRWTNYLRPDLIHDGFTPEEEECIIELHRTLGSRWSLIAKRLPGRTDNDVKNYWNTKLKKKLTKMGIDPVTHKPFSQLYNEYSKITVNRNNPFLRNSSGNESLWKHENIPQKIDRQFSYYDLLSRKDQRPVQLVVPFQPLYFNEASSSDTFSSLDGVTPFGCGPSGSCDPSQAQIVPSCDSFVYRECISGEPTWSADSMDQIPGCKFMDMLSLDSGSVSLQEEGPVMEKYSPSPAAAVAVVAASSSADSFVDTIFAHDSEMRLQFPSILDENYDY